tara:strand:+ start:336 stop:710 length:375 start_codon:yes stop_codon:yes gene_type:complete
VSTFWVTQINIESLVDNSNNEAEICFRFNKLDKLQALTLVREILGSSYEEHFNNNCYVGCVPLTDKNLDDINDFYVRQRVDIEACDIFVSVNSDSGTKMIGIPVVVNIMLKYLDVKLVFSFTVV